MINSSYLYTKLKETRIIKKSINNIILLVMAITFLLLSIYSLYFLIILVIYFGYLYKKDKDLFYISIVLITIVFVIYLFLIHDNKVIETKITGKIIDASYYDEYAKYIIRANGKKILLYDYNDFNLKVGNIVSISGTYKDTASSYTPNSFDYSKYLDHKRIFYSLVIDTIEAKKEGFSIGIIRQKIINYFDNNYSASSSSFLKALLLGYSNSLDEEFYNSVKTNGIIHLFAISGLHITFFVGLLTICLNKIKLKLNYQKLIICFFLIFYIIITNFTPSILRTALMYFLTVLTKKDKFSLRSSDICSLSFIICLISNDVRQN